MVAWGLRGPGTVGHYGVPSIRWGGLVEEFPQLLRLRECRPSGSMRSEWGMIMGTNRPTLEQHPVSPAQRRQSPVHPSDSSDWGHRLPWTVRPRDCRWNFEFESQGFELRKRNFEIPVFSSFTDPGPPLARCQLWEINNTACMVGTIYNSALTPPRAPSLRAPHITVATLCAYVLGFCPHLTGYFDQIHMAKASGPPLRLRRPPSWLYFSLGGALVVEGGVRTACPNFRIRALTCTRPACSSPGVSSRLPRPTATAWDARPATAAVPQVTVDRDAKRAWMPMGRWDDHPCVRVPTRSRRR